ncbi:hypothetical protein AAG570_001166 [Ranatra chinensis]|uniref:UBA domain-containing protein n=1 Tax=Ranatra chinensis TaxID=642074 RepID=A0ABD0YB21_9HEMI
MTGRQNTRPAWIDLENIWISDPEEDDDGDMGRPWWGNPHHRYRHRQQHSNPIRGCDGRFRGFSSADRGAESDEGPMKFVHPCKYISSMRKHLANLVDPLGGIVIDEGKCTTSNNSEKVKSSNKETVVPMVVEGAQSSTDAFQATSTEPSPENNGGNGDKSESHKESAETVQPGSTVKNERDTVSSPVENDWTVVHPANIKVEDSLMKMLAMGFNNEGDWLRQMLEAKDGNIDSVLELLMPSNLMRNIYN